MKWKIVIIIVELLKQLYALRTLNSTIESVNCSMFKWVSASWKNMEEKKKQRSIHWHLHSIPFIYDAIILLIHFYFQEKLKRNKVEKKNKTTNTLIQIHGRITFIHLPTLTRILTHTNSIQHEQMRRMAVQRKCGRKNDYGLEPQVEPNQITLVVQVTYTFWNAKCHKESCQTFPIRIQLYSVVFCFQFPFHNFVFMHWTSYCRRLRVIAVVLLPLTLWSSDLILHNVQIIINMFRGLRQHNVLESSV